MLIWLVINCVANGTAAHGLGSHTLFTLQRSKGEQLPVDPGSSCVRDDVKPGRRWACDDDCSADKFPFGAGRKAAGFATLPGAESIKGCASTTVLIAQATSDFLHRPAT